MDLTGLTLFHGSAAGSVTPTFGLGDDRHDYGKGFYLSDDIKSPRAFAALEKVAGYPRPVPYGDYNAKYNERDKQARDRMDELISGPANKAVRVMSTLVEGNA